jgi:molecular chaperone GrpE (heat shock protein)
MPEGKALIEQVTTFRDEVNQATLKIDEQINFVKKEILELKNDPQNCGYSIEQELQRKEMELENLRKIWQQEKEKASKGVDGCVSI